MADEGPRDRAAQEAAALAAGRAWLARHWESVLTLQAGRDPVRGAAARAAFAEEPYPELARVEEVLVAVRHKLLTSQDRALAQLVDDAIAPQEALAITSDLREIEGEVAAVWQGLRATQRAWPHLDVHARNFWLVLVLTTVQRVRRRREQVEIRLRS